jgi:hypothetical protein
MAATDPSTGKLSAADTAGMTPSDQASPHPPRDSPSADAELISGRCAICGRDLWSDGLTPARDGNAWICGDCDQARNFEADFEAGLGDD